MKSRAQGMNNDETITEMFDVVCHLGDGRMASECLTKSEIIRERGASRVACLISTLNCAFILPSCFYGGYCKSQEVT